MAAAALAVERPIRIDAIAGPTIEKARLVDGAEAQKPNAARPQIPIVLLRTRIAGQKTERQSPRLVRDENGRWVRECPKAIAPV